MPFAAVLHCLNASAGGNAGVHVNEFVPGIASHYKALSLGTSALATLSAEAKNEGQVV